MSKKIAYGGILLSANAIILMLINIIPMNTIFILGIASLPISMYIMRYGLISGISYYVCLTIISFFVISNKAQWLLFILTFGLYGLVKYIIEKDRHFIIEYLLKILFANIMMFILYFIAKEFIYININLLTIIIFEFIFLVYDYMYSGFIDYFSSRYLKMKNY